MRVEDLIAVAHRAGEAILEYYRSGKISVEWKADGSPLTQADQASNRAILEDLAQLAPYPILSEEVETPPFEERKNWNRFWLVDPLDGTQDFIQKNDEFCVLIALIENGRPILGVLHAPALRELYYAEEGKGAFRYRPGGSERIFSRPLGESAIARSRFHDSLEVSRFALKNRIQRNIPIGSALKFARIAEGKVDLYPRFTKMHEWDLAGGHILLKEAGAGIIRLEDGKEPRYNTADLRCAPFLAFGKGVDVESLQGWRGEGK